MFSFRAKSYLKTTLFRGQTTTRLFTFFQVFTLDQNEKNCQLNKLSLVKPNRMMETVNQAATLEEDQILTLPDEVFLHIFSFVSNRHLENTALVCSKFYDLLCILERDKHPLDLCYSEVRFISSFHFFALLKL